MPSAEELDAAIFAADEELPLGGERDLLESSGSAYPELASGESSEGIQDLLLSLGKTAGEVLVKAGTSAANKAPAPGGKPQTGTPQPTPPTPPPVRIVEKPVAAKANTGVIVGAVLAGVAVTGGLAYALTRSSTRRRQRVEVLPREVVPALRSSSRVAPTGESPSWQRILTEGGGS